MSQQTWSGRFQTRTVLLLLAIFASGILAGIALESRVLRNNPEATYAIWRPAVKNGIPTRLLRLGLTEEQQTRMREISARWQPQADSIMSNLEPRVREIEHGMFQEMACVLTPAQDSAYIAWRKKEGMNLAEGEEQMARRRAGTCP